MNRPQRVYWWTLIAWVAAVTLQFALYLMQAYAQPPTDEVLTRLLGFQIAAFALVHLPCWLAGLLIVLLGEVVVRACASAPLRRGERLNCVRMTLRRKGNWKRIRSAAKSCLRCFGLSPERRWRRVSPEFHPR